MRTIVTIFLIYALQFVCNAQSTLQWQQIYGGPGVEIGYSVKTCLGQGYIVAGSSSSNGPSDGYLVRTDSVGLSMWEKYYGGGNIDVIRSVKLLPDSGFILCGYTNSFGAGGYDGWVLRMDKLGDTLWTKTIGTTDWDFFYDITCTWDSGFVVAGGTFGIGNGSEDMYIVKLDSLGNTIWTRTWGGTDTDEARGIIETEDSLLVTCGVTYSFGDTLGDSWILRIDGNNGDTLWTRLGTHTTGADLALGVASGNSRFGVVGQYTNASGDLQAYVHIMQLDSSTIYDLTAGINGYEYYSSIVFMRSGNFATLGSTENDGGGSGDMFLFHDVDYSAHSYGTTNFEAGNSIDTTIRKGYIACGSTEGFNSIQSNLYLVKIDSLGFSSTVLSIRESPVESGRTVAFPNPCDHSITIMLDGVNPIENNLKIRVYDVTGRIMDDLSSPDWNYYSASSASCELSTLSLNHGIYYYVVLDSSGESYRGNFVVCH